MVSPRQKTPTPSKRKGKQVRKNHPIYAIETALNLNHANIADLSTKDYLSVEQIEHICFSPLAAPLPSEINAARVAKMITGEYPQLWQKVSNRLAFRLGISMKSLIAFSNAGLRDRMHRLLSKETVREHLVSLQEQINAGKADGWKMSLTEGALRNLDRLVNCS